jgi:hypothetical protein
MHEKLDTDAHDMMCRLVYRASGHSLGSVCGKMPLGLRPQAVITMAAISVQARNWFICMYTLIGCVDAVWNGDQLSGSIHRNSLASAKQDVLLRTPAQKHELEEIHRTSVQKRLGSVTARGHTPEDANLGWGGNVRLRASCISSFMCLCVPHLHVVCMPTRLIRACRAAPHCNSAGSSESFRHLSASILLSLPCMQTVIRIHHEL